MEFSLLAQMVDALPTAVVLVDGDAIIRHVNREMEATLQYSKAELIDLPLDLLLPERFRVNHAGLFQSYVRAPVMRSMGKGQPLFARRKDGQEIEIEIGLNPIQTSRGLYVLATMTNVTQRKKADQLFRQVVESAPYGVLVMDKQGQIMLVNKMLSETFGYQGAELIGKKIENLLPERYRSSHIEQRGQYAEKPVTRKMGPGRDLTGLHKDGTEIPVEIGLNPIEIQGEVCMMAAITDITERKKMETDLRRVNANLEEFTYVASHDLRSPLRGIADLLSWIEEDLGSSVTPDVKKNLDRVSLRINRMERLIDNLLSYARAGRAATEFQEVDLNVLLKHIFDLVQVPPSFVVERELRCEKLNTTLTPLETVLRNLISNAIKHHDRESGKIILKSFIEDSYCVIEISDDGPGIPVQAQDRVFKLFQTLTASERGSTGIGLAVCKRLTETHGGSISLYSDPLQRVTRFTVKWPRFARRDINDTAY